MIRKILNGQAKTITSAAVIIGAASLTSRLLGVIRDRVLASEFGVGDALDAYYAAFRLPDTVFNLIVLGALSAGFIPIFSDLIDENKEKAWRFANNVLCILIVTLLVVCGILAIFTPWCMQFIAPGFEGEKYELTVLLTRIMFISPFLLGISSLFGGILQSFKRFFVYSLAPIFYNLGIIFGALVFTQFWGVSGLAVGVVLGALLHLLIQLPTAEYLGFRYMPYCKLRDPHMKHLFKIMIPRMLSLGVTQINLIVMTIIATLMAAGSLTIFNFATNLSQFPIGIFGISFAIAAFPTLCELARKKDTQDFVESFSNTIRQILFFIIPISALFIILRAQIVRVILGGGLFDWPATIATADALAVFSLSLFAQALIPLYVRAFFAYKNSHTPLYVGLVSVIVNIGLAYHFFTSSYSLFGYPVHSVTGLAMAFSISMILNFVLLWALLRIKLGSLNDGKVIWSTAKIVFATLIMGMVTQFMKFGVEPFFGTRTFVGVLLQGVISGLVGIAVFVVVGLLINMQELTTFIASLKTRLIRQKSGLGEEEGIDSTVD
jgi:putative peptidoglycan lipid II flippase